MTDVNFKAKIFWGFHSVFFLVELVKVYSGVSFTLVHVLYLDTPLRYQYSAYIGLPSFLYNVGIVTVLS